MPARPPGAARSSILFPPAPASAPAPLPAPLPEPLPAHPLAPAREVAAPAVPFAVASPTSVEPYETFYGFEEQPFGDSTDPKFFYYGVAHDEASQNLLSAIRARKGLVLISAPDGLGKTMVCRNVMEQLDRRTVTSLVDASSLSIDGLLRTVLADFGVISREDLARGGLRTASERELTAALRDFLQSLTALQASAVVILDGADRMPFDVLQQVRAWSDSETDLRLLQVVLVGGPSLAARLRRKDLRPLDAKVAVRITLGPIAADEIEGYVAHRLSVAGTNPRVEFDLPALAAVYRCTGGVPREINALCNRALVKGASGSLAVIDAAIVAEAADELDLIPTESVGAAVVRRTALAVGFVLLVLAGAAAAAFVFQEPFGRLIDLWVRSPR